MEVNIGQNKILNQVSSEPLWIICQAESKPSGEHVWFKILSQELYSDAELVERFHESATISAALRHPHILTCYEHGVEEGLHFIAIEHFEGKRLIDVLDAEKQLPLERAILIISQIAKALQYAHIHGVLHGALNPNSVFIDQKDFVKVMNFGSSRLMEYLLHSKADDSVLKFAGYISPEQAVPNSQVSGRSDIYSLGVLFYEMVTGQLPFVRKHLKSLFNAHKEIRPSSPRIIVPRIPGHIEGIILRQLAKDPNERFHNCTSLLYELLPEYKEETLEESEAEPWKVSRWSRIASWVSAKIPHQLRIFSPTLVGSRRRIALAFFSISLLIVIVVLVTLLSGLGSRSSEQDMYAYLDWMAEENEEKDPDFIADSKEKGTEAVAKDVQQKPKENVNIGSHAEESTSDLQSSPPLQVTRPTTTQQEQKLQDSGIKESERTTQSSFQTLPVLAPAVSETQESEYGTLVVYAIADSLPTTASVYLDGELVGQTSAQQPLRIPQVEVDRSHSLRILKPGYRAVEKNVSMQTNGENTVSVAIKPLADAMKRFYFRPVSFADRVIINNQLPSRPLPCEVDLAVGKHRIKYIDSQSGFHWDTQLLLDLDSPEDIYFDSKDIGNGILTVVIRNAAQFGYAYVHVDGESALNRTTPYRNEVPVGRHSVRVTREGFSSLPADTTVFVRLGQETDVVFKLKPQ